MGEREVRRRLQGNLLQPRATGLAVKSEACLVAVWTWYVAVTVPR